MSKKILLSGVQPTGRPHLGNYFGAMKQMVEIQNSGMYETYFMIADYHALNFIQDQKTMHEHIYDLTLDYLALGLNKEQSAIFKQSDIGPHTELTWIFDTITTMPYLMRAHAFKDAEARNKEISVGTFNYPMLMAADILLYDADVVPVGQDQKQHIEYTRDTAIKFNNTFGETFKLPEPLIVESVAIVPGIDGRKMSKSYGNTIPLFASYEEISKAVMSIVTDSGSDIPLNVYNIHKLVKSEEELKPLYEANKGKYKILKEALITDLEAFISPLRERRNELAKNPQLAQQTLEEGRARALARAGEKMKVVKEKIGVM